MVSTKPPSGVRDFFNEPAAQRQSLIEIISRVYRAFGFHPLETSALENLDVLLGSGGGDENEKLIFKIMKRGEKLKEAATKSSAENDLADFGLRFDLTVPLSRVAAEYRNEIRLPWKVFHIAPVWRAERAQKGRFREFIQCDVDILGATGIGAELEVIQAVAEALKAVGVQGVELKVNHRALLDSLAESFGFSGERKHDFVILLDKADKMERAKWIAEFESLAGKNQRTEIDEVLNGGLSLEKARSMNSESADQVGALIDGLNESGVPFSKISFDATLARGMGYYTGLIFELRHSSAGYSIGGGGRYDQLIGRFSKQTIPACGFSIGFDRLHLMMMESTQKTRKNSLFIPVFDEKLRAPLMKIAAELVSEQIEVDVYPDEAKVKNQMRFASESKYQWVLIAGEDEFQRKVFKLKDFESGKEAEIQQTQLAAELKKYLRP